MRKSLQKGQVTLLAVILGVLGLTLGLSVASRSLTDLRQASTVDVGTKALAASEAAAEYALSQLSLVDPTTIDTCTDVYLVDKPNSIAVLPFDPSLGIKKLSYKICQGPTNQARSGEISKDEVYQVDFSGSAPTQDLGIYWTGAPGIEVSALYSNYRVNRYAFRALNQLGSSDFNEVSTTGAPAPCDSTFPTPLAYTGTGPQPSNINYQAGGSLLTLLRIKPVGGSAQILVCNGNIPAQYYEVTTRAETTNGTIKRVKVTRDVSGALPSIFDNVLYSGGDIIKD